MNDGSSIFNLINNLKPDEVYNLAAQSHVKVSFEIQSIQLILTRWVLSDF